MDQKMQRFSNLRVEIILWISLVLTIIYRTMMSIQIIPNIAITKVILYLLIFIPLILCSIKMYLDFPVSGRHYTYFYEMKKILLVVGVFAFISVIKMIHARNFSAHTVMELLQIAMPFIYTFFVINFLNPKLISSFMKIALITTVIGYTWHIGLDKLTIHNLLSISFLSSYSPFEDFVFAEAASGLAAYFIYKHKEEPYYCIAAVILNFFIFKRVLLLMAFVLVVIVLTHKEHKKVDNKVIKYSIIGWFILIVVVYILYQPSVAKFIKDFMHIDLVRFTSARVYRLWHCVEHSFHSYGLGSTTVYLSHLKPNYVGNEFEMDFIRFMFEVGPIAVAVFIYSYFKICRRNLYAYALISMCFLNLLMANGILNYTGWTYRIITIALINHYDVHGKRIVHRDEKNHFRSNIRFIRNKEK